jgi:hypothetical protein
MARGRAVEPGNRHGVEEAIPGLSRKCADWMDIPMEG